MQTATCHLRSVSPYSQSQSLDHQTAKPERGKADEHDEKNWRLKAHATQDGHVFIPQMSFKMALDAASKMMGVRIPGKGQATFTKYFKAGVLVLEPVVLSQKISEMPHDLLFVNADGVRGSGKRVWKRFPRIDNWDVKVPFHVIAPEITKEVFEQTIRQAGAFVGIGRFRPENGGFYGRFETVKVEWS